MKMNAMTEALVKENGFCPYLIDRLDQFLNYSCWEYKAIFYLQIEVRLSYADRRRGNESIQKTLEQMQEPFKSRRIRTSFVWTKKTDVRGRVTVSFIFLGDGHRVQHSDEITEVIDTYWNIPYDELIVQKEGLGKVFGDDTPAGNIAMATITQYEMLADCLIDLAWYYPQSRSRELNFGSSQIGRKMYPIPVQRQGDQTVNAITGEIKQPFKNLRNWHLGDQVCIDF